MAAMLTVSTCVCWSAADSAADPKAPMKFYIPHVPASFGPGGQLVCVCPSSPSDGQTALVELHSMEVSKSLCPQKAPCFPLPEPGHLLEQGALVGNWAGSFSGRRDAGLTFSLRCYWLSFSHWRTHFLHEA